MFFFADAILGTIDLQFPLILSRNPVPNMFCAANLASKASRF
jgi:hypothetical protein